MITDIEYDLLPCPYCGRKLTVKNLRFFDQDSYIGDMENISDFDHILDPRNSSIPQDWEGMDEADREVVGQNYKEAVEAVEEIQLACTCGAFVAVDRWRTSYPEEGWLEELGFLVNRRDERAMEVALQHSVDVLADGPVRRAYQAALSALQAIPGVVKQACEDAEEAQAWLDARGDDDDY